MKNKKIIIFLSFLITLLLLITPIFNAEIIINQSFYDDTITVDPENPTGDHGWYISPVEVTFHAHDPPQGQ